VLGLLVAQRRDARVAVGGEDDEALGGEPTKRLTQGRDADGHRARELFLVDRLAGRQRAARDLLPQMEIGMVGLGLEEDGADHCL
jgi:hypothetical protein